MIDQRRRDRIVAGSFDQFRHHSMTRQIGGDLLYRHTARGRIDGQHHHLGSAAQQGHRRAHCLDAGIRPVPRDQRRIASARRMHPPAAADIHPARAPARHYPARVVPFRAIRAAQARSATGLSRAVLRVRSGRAGAAGCRCRRDTTASRSADRDLADPAGRLLVLADRELEHAVAIFRLDPLGIDIRRQGEPPLECAIAAFADQAVARFLLCFGTLLTGKIERIPSANSTLMSLSSRPGSRLPVHNGLSCP